MIKIYGKNCIYEAIRANSKIQKVYISFEVSKKDLKFLSMLRDKHIGFETIDKKRMDQFLELDTKDMEHIVRTILFIMRGL